VSPCAFPSRAPASHAQALCRGRNTTRPPCRSCRCHRGAAALSHHLVEFEDVYLKLTCSFNYLRDNRNTVDARSTPPGTGDFSNAPPNLKMPAARPRASFEPIPPDFDVRTFVETAENFQYVDRISYEMIASNGMEQFEKLVLLHVIIGGKPLVIDGFEEVLDPWTFTPSWLRDNHGEKSMLTASQNCLRPATNIP
jgi:hypothetical protein